MRRTTAGMRKGSLTIFAVRLSTLILEASSPGTPSPKRQWSVPRQSLRSESRVFVVSDEAPPGCYGNEAIRFTSMFWGRLMRHPLLANLHQILGRLTSSSLGYENEDPSNPNQASARRRNQEGV